MSEIARDTYMNVLDSLYRGKLLINQEDVFILDNHTQIGRIGAELVFQKFPNVKFDDLKKIVCLSLNYPKKDFDATTENQFYEIISKKVMGFQTLPNAEIEEVNNSLRALIQKYEEIKTGISEKLDEIDNLIRYDKDNPTNNGYLIKKQESLRSKNIANRKLTKDLKKIEAQYEEITEEMQNRYVYQETLKYAISRINSMLDKIILNLTDEELKHNVHEITIQICTESSTIRNSYNYYKDYLQSLEAWQDVTTSLYKPFFKIKNRKFHADVVSFFNDNYYNFDNRENELITICQDKVNQIIPSDEWIRKKQSNEDEYQEMINDTLQKYNVLEYCSFVISHTYCLQRRRSLLQLILDYYKHGEYLVFINLAVLQIEGLFKDLFIDANIGDRLVGNFDLYESDDLRKKFDKNTNLSDMEEATIYFKFYFNNLLRNKVAHGNVYSNIKSLKTVASELLLDMQYVLYLTSEKSETSKAISYIKNTVSWLEFSFERPQKEENIYLKLLNKLNSNVITEQKGDVGYGDMQRELYWIFNPYYDEAYSFSEVTSLRNKMIEYLTSCEFWDFVLSYIMTYDKTDIWAKVKINNHFKSRVKAIMGYVSSNKMDSLQTLIRVNQELEKLHI